jgi:hypothetical protein
MMDDGKQTTEGKWGKRNQLTPSEDAGSPVRQKVPDLRYLQFTGYDL